MGRERKGGGGEARALRERERFDFGCSPEPYGSNTAVDSPELREEQLHKELKRNQTSV